MAKRTNILTTIKRELDNGKILMDNEGFFCTQEEADKKAKEAYIKAIKEDDSLLDKGITLDKFKETAGEYLKTADVLATITDTLFPKVKESEPKQATVEEAIEQAEKGYTDTDSVKEKLPFSEPILEETTSPKEKGKGKK